MKKMNRLYKLTFVLLIAFFLTGCRKVKQYVNTNELVIKYKSYEKYDIKYDEKFFRNIREQAIIIGSDFKIGIEELIEIKDKKDFEKFKKQYVKEEDYKEVKYSGYKGFMIYTLAYMRYEIYLNIDNQHVLRLNIYSANDPKEFQTKALNSKEVKGILNHMKVKIK